MSIEKPKPKRAPRARGNPVGSPWRDGGPRATRRRAPIELTLSPDAHAALVRLAEGHGGNRSAAAEEAIIEADLVASARQKNRRRPVE